MKKSKNIALIAFAVSLLFTPLSYSAAEEIADVAVKETPVQIKIMVQKTFADDPVMVTIAQCESGYRQYTDSGNIFRGSGRYVGIFQIDEYIHKDAGLALGFDIYTAQGNVAYAQHIFKKEGTRPWANCAKKYTPVAAESSDNQDDSASVSDLGTGLCPVDMQVNQTLRSGSRDPKNANGVMNQQVKLLQMHINRILKERYDEAAGPVDGIFGPKTKLGVQRLQVALNEVLKPNPALVIDGIVGPFTRSAINNSCSK